MKARLLRAVAGAVALLGVGTGEVLAQAANDPTGAVRDGIGYLGVPGTILRLRISSDLLANDSGRNIRFRRAFRISGNEDEGGQNPSSAGILSIRRSGNFLLIRLANNFTGTSSFKYEISYRNPGSRRTFRSRANVFIVADMPSPA